MGEIRIRTSFNGSSPANATNNSIVAVSGVFATTGVLDLYIDNIDGIDALSITGVAIVGTGSNLFTTISGPTLGSLAASQTTIWRLGITYPTGFTFDDFDGYINTKFVIANDDSNENPTNIFASGQYYGTMTKPSARSYSHTNDGAVWIEAQHDTFSDLDLGAYLVRAQYHNGTTWRDLGKVPYGTWQTYDNRTNPASTGTQILVHDFPENTDGTFAPKFRIRTEKMRWVLRDPSNNPVANFAHSDPTYRRRNYGWLALIEDASPWTSPFSGGVIGHTGGFANPSGWNPPVMNSNQRFGYAIGFMDSSTTVTPSGAVHELGVSGGRLRNDIVNATNGVSGALVNSFYANQWAAGSGWLMFDRCFGVFTQSTDAPKYVDSNNVDSEFYSFISWIGNSNTNYKYINPTMRPYLLATYPLASVTGHRENIIDVARNYTDAGTPVMFYSCVANIRSLCADKTTPYAKTRSKICAYPYIQANALIGEDVGLSDIYDLRYSSIDKSGSLGAFAELGEMAQQFNVPVFGEPSASVHWRAELMDEYSSWNDYGLWSLYDGNPGAYNGWPGVRPDRITQGWGNRKYIIGIYATIVDSDIAALYPGTDNESVAIKNCLQAIRLMEVEPWKSLDIYPIFYNQAVASNAMVPAKQGLATDAAILWNQMEKAYPRLNRPSASVAASGSNAAYVYITDLNSNYYYAIDRKPIDSVNISDFNEISILQPGNSGYLDLGGDVSGYHYRVRSFYGNLDNLMYSPWNYLDVTGYLPLPDSTGTIEPTGNPDNTSGVLLQSPNRFTTIIKVGATDVGINKIRSIYKGGLEERNDIANNTLGSIPSDSIFAQTHVTEIYQKYLNVENGTYENKGTSSKDIGNDTSNDGNRLTFRSNIINNSGVNG